MLMVNDEYLHTIIEEQFHEYFDGIADDIASIVVDAVEGHLKSLPHECMRGNRVYHAGDAEPTA